MTRTKQTDFSSVQEEIDRFKKKTEKVKKLPEKVGEKNAKGERVSHFEIKNNTLFFINTEGDNDEYQFVSRNTPIIKSKMADLESGQLFYTIEFQDNHRTIVRDVPASAVVKKSELLKLADYGLSVNENNAGTLIKFLDVYIREKEPEFHEVATRVGYINGNFIHPEFSGNTKIVAESGFKQIVDNIKSKGTLDEYASNVFNQVAGETTAMFFMLSALASPLLKYYNVNPFIVDNATRTSTGKTTLLNLCASIWGTSLLVNEWNTTTVAFERKASFLNSYPLLMDDTRKAQPWLLKDVAYHFSGGRSKGRGNVKSIDQELTYDNILLSTGEVPLTDYNAEMGGVAARVISITEMPFSFKDFRDLYNSMGNYYGTLGPAFIEQWESEKEYYSTAYEIISNKYFDRTKGNEVLSRLGRNYAIIELAGMILNDIPGFQFEYIEVMNATFEIIEKDEENTYNKPKLMMKSLLEYVDSMRMAIKRGTSNDNQNINAIAIYKGNGLFVPVKVVNDFLENEKKSIKKQWRETGMVKEYSQGESVTVTYGKEKQRCICIPENILDDYGFDFGLDIY